MHNILFKSPDQEPFVAWSLLSKERVNTYGTIIIMLFQNSPMLLHEMGFQRFGLDLTVM